MKSIEVAAAVICRDGEVLATQRGYGDFAGRWEFPGGKIEPGEFAQAAAVREVQEELDLTIAVESLLASVDYEYETFHLHMQCFLARIEYGELRLLEHRAARWLDASTIDSVDWLPADIQVVEAIKGAGIVK